MLATFFHAGCSAFLVSFIRNRQFVLGLSVPILLHTTLDVAEVYASVHQLDRWLVLAILALFSFLATALAALSLFRKEPATEAVS
jgi:hypothetical protein